MDHGEAELLGLLRHATALLLLWSPVVPGHLPTKNPLYGQRVSEAKARDPPPPTIASDHASLVCAHHAQHTSPRSPPTSHPPSHLA